jgi:hypothetical protein
MLLDLDLARSRFAHLDVFISENLRSPVLVDAYGCDHDQNSPQMVGACALSTKSLKTVRPDLGRGGA